MCSLKDLSSYLSIYLSWLTVDKVIAIIISAYFLLYGSVYATISCENKITFFQFYLICKMYTLYSVIMFPLPKSLLVSAPLRIVNRCCSGFPVNGGIPVYEVSRPLKTFNL